MSSSNVTQCAETKDTSENITTRRRSNDDLLSGLSYPSCHFLQMEFPLLLAHFKNKTKSIRRRVTDHICDSMSCHHSE